MLNTAIEITNRLRERIDAKAQELLALGFTPTDANRIATLQVMLETLG